jgi:transposase
MSTRNDAIWRALNQAEREPVDPLVARTLHKAAHDALGNEREMLARVIADELDPLRAAQGLADALGVVQ